MTNAELLAKIKAEIDKRYAEYREKMKTDDFTYYEGMADALDLFEQFIDALEEPVPADLEEAARNYAMRDKWTYEHFGDMVMKAVFFGAKWQEEQDKGTIELAEDHAFLAGADWQKEQGVLVHGEVELDFSDPDDIYARRLLIDYYKELGPALMKFNPKDKVIIQIRKEKEQ